MPGSSSSQSVYKLNGRIALITGATGDLGAAVALAFLGAGATVVGVSHREDADRRAAIVAGADDAARLIFAVADVGDEGAVEQLIAGVVAAHGRLDIVVNTVGGYSAGKPVTELDLSVWERMLALNLKPTYLVSKYAGRVMAAQSWGRIINVASRSAFTGKGNAAAYAVAKRGVITLTEAQAEELRDAHVTVNAIAPSIIDTPPNRASMPHADASHWPKPQEIARVMLFLASDDAALISGAAIPVYGLA